LQTWLLPPHSISIVGHNETLPLGRPDFGRHSRYSNFYKIVVSLLWRKQTRVA
jgi:hypothetical protein